MVLVAIGLLGLSACSSGDRSNASNLNHPPVSAPLPDGKKLWERNCASCHGEGSLSAPSMAQIATAYSADQLKVGEFSRNMLNFLKNPSRETSKMLAAVEKYSLMPKLAIPEKDLEEIAKYIHQQSKVAPNAAPKTSQNANGEINYLLQGKEFALQTKATLSKNLLAAIEQKGSAGAVTFCNTRGIRLADSVVTSLKARIKRVSDKPRNAQNVASAEELKTIQTMKAALAAGHEAKPAFNDMGKKYIGYYPITTNAMCLQCHGKKEVEVKAETLAELKKRYPKDLATGYGENELRGIWVVEMEKK